MWQNLVAYHQSQARLKNQKFPEMVLLAIIIVVTFWTRTAGLGLFLAHDEAMRNRQSLDSFQAIVEGRWGDIYSSNFGATNLTWARTAAKLVHYGWLRAQGVEVSLAEMVNIGPAFDPLPGAVFNALLVVILYWFTRKLFDGRVALLGTALLALDAYLLSEARILRTESAFATFFTLTLICATLYLQTRRRRDLVWTGVWTGWTIATKTSGVVLFPILGFILLITAWKITPSFKALGRFSVDVIIWLAVSLGCIFSIWPTLWVKPLQTFYELYQLMFFFAVVSKESLDFFYLGQVVPELPAFYYVLVLLYKTTPLVWLGVALFIWAAWPSGWVRSTQPGVSMWLSSGLILLVAALLYTIAMMVAVFKTERYMMATVSLLDIVAAVGLVLGSERLYHGWRARLLPARGFWLGAIIIFLAGHGIFAWLNFPYYFSYHNPLLGGGPTAAKLIQIGSGEGLDMALNYLASKPDPAGQVVVCGTNLPRCEYGGPGQTWLNREALNAINGRWVSADYVVTYIFHNQRHEYPAGVIDYLEKQPGPAYVARFQGIDYAKVYPAPQAQYVAASELTGIATLLGYSLDKQKLAAGEALSLKLYWENDGHIEQDMFVRLVDTDNYIWAETTAPFAPGFAGLEHQVGAIIEGQAHLLTPPTMPPGHYYLKMGYQTGQDELIGLFELPSGGDQIEVTLPDTFAAEQTWPNNLNLAVDASLTLAGYTLDQEKLAPGEPVWLTLWWQAKANVQHDYVINLRLLDPTGSEVAYWLGRPVRSGYPTNGWLAGQPVQDPWLLTLPTDLPPGQYRLDVVLFDAETTQAITQANLSTVDVTKQVDTTVQ